MNVGLLARGDAGGLAAQTYEMWRHLRPQRVLLIDLGPTGGRGPTDPHRYDADWCDVTHYRWRESLGLEVEQFLDGLDVVLTAETVYDDRLFALARNLGVAVVVQINPELFWDATRYADVLWNPTEWRLEYLPDRVEVVPFPIALDMLPYRRRTNVEVLFHTAAEAMLDRNGTQIVEAAMFHVEHPCKLYIRGIPEPQHWQWRAGKVSCEWLPPVDEYWQVIPDDTDLMLLPRRYGGLCLPTQEAAARGIPTVMTALSPQSHWFAPDLLVRAPVERQAVSMKGGPIDVHTCEPKRLAAVVNQLMRPGSDRIARASDEVRAWALNRSWERKLPEWQQRLEAAAETKVHR